MTAVLHLLYFSCSDADAVFFRYVGIFQRQELSSLVAGQTVLHIVLFRIAWQFCPEFKSSNVFYTSLFLQHSLDASVQVQTMVEPIWAQFTSWDQVEVPQNTLFKGLKDHLAPQQQQWLHTVKQFICAACSCDSVGL